MNGLTGAYMCFTRCIAYGVGRNSVHGALSVGKWHWKRFMSLLVDIQLVDNQSVVCVYGPVARWKSLSTSESMLIVVCSTDKYVYFLPHFVWSCRCECPHTIYSCWMLIDLVRRFQFEWHRTSNKQKFTIVVERSVETKNDCFPKVIDIFPSDDGVSSGSISIVWNYVISMSHCRMRIFYPCFRENVVAMWTISVFFFLHSTQYTHTIQSYTCIYEL